MSEKKVKIKVFVLEEGSTNLTESEQSSILALIEQALNENRKAVNDRRMPLNKQDKDEDLLSSYQWHKGNNQYVFGLMIRLIPTETAQMFSSSLFDQDQVTLQELTEQAKIELNSNTDKKSRVCAEYFYFMLSDKYLLTNLSTRLQSIERLQTYLNWLIDKQRKKLYSFQPKLVLPDPIQIKDIKSFELGDGSKIRANLNNEQTNIATKFKDLSVTLLGTLFKDCPELHDIDLSDVFSAKLVISVLKRKPKDLSKDDFQKVMGALIKPLTEESGFSIIDKGGRSLSGEEIKLVKEIKIETTTNNFLNEEQLKQKMEEILNDLNSKK